MELRYTGTDVLTAYIHMKSRLKELPLKSGAALIRSSNREGWINLSKRFIPIDNVYKAQLSDWR